MQKTALFTLKRTSVWVVFKEPALPGLHQCFQLFLCNKRGPFAPRDGCPYLHHSLLYQEYLIVIAQQRLEAAAFRFQLFQQFGGYELHQIHNWTLSADIPLQSRRHCVQITPFRQQMLDHNVNDFRLYRAIQSGAIPHLLDARSRLERGAPSTLWILSRRFGFGIYEPLDSPTVVHEL